MLIVIICILYKNMLNKISNLNSFIFYYSILIIILTNFRKVQRQIGMYWNTNNKYIKHEKLIDKQRQAERLKLIKQKQKEKRKKEKQLKKENKLNNYKKEKSKLVVIGKAKFDQNISSPMRHYFLQSVKFLQDKTWAFRQHNYKQLGQELFVHMKECNVNNLQFKNILYLQTQIPNFTKVNFQNLISIIVIDCGLTNIEFIHFLNSAKINNFNFNCNEISNIKTLNKTNLEKFGSISVVANPLHQIDFSRMKFKYAIKGIFIQQILTLDRTTKVTENDVSKFIKLQAKRANFFFHSSKTRICQKKVQRMTSFPTNQPVGNEKYRDDENYNYRNDYKYVNGNKEQKRIDPRYEPYDPECGGWGFWF